LHFLPLWAEENNGVAGALPGDQRSTGALDYDYSNPFAALPNKNAPLLNAAGIRLHFLPLWAEENNGVAGALPGDQRSTGALDYDYSNPFTALPNKNAPFRVRSRDSFAFSSALGGRK